MLSKSLKYQKGKYFQRRRLAVTGEARHMHITGSRLFAHSYANEINLSERIREQGTLLNY